MAIIMRKYSVIIFLGIIIISLLIVSSCHWSFKPKKPECFEKENMLYLEFNGEVIRKFRDHDNHNYNALIVEDFKNRKKIKMFFINEKSGSFNLINLEDTLVKKLNTLVIIDVSQKKEFKLLYDCDE